MILTQGSFNIKDQPLVFPQLINTPSNTNRTLVDVKLAKLAQIESARDMACLVDVAAAGHLWQADKRSVELLNGAISLAQAGLPLPAVWRSSDNVDVPVTSIANLLAIAGAIAVQVQTAYARSWALKAQVAAALAIVDVEIIVW